MDKPLAPYQVKREAKLQLRLKKLSNNPSDFIHCAEYQIFLDDVRFWITFRQPDHWEGYEFPPGEGNSPVIGVRGEDAQAFCAWLTERENSPQPGWRYRLPNPNEIIPDENIGCWTEQHGKLDCILSPTGTQQ